jgi:hypothetical protein
MCSYVLANGLIRLSKVCAYTASFGLYHDLDDSKLDYRILNCIRFHLGVCISLALHYILNVSHILYDSLLNF